jgi:hypothetical protein
LCRDDTIRSWYAYIRYKFVSCFGAGDGLMTIFRILAVLYVFQADVGVATGVAYAVWLLYW